MSDVSNELICDIMNGLGYKVPLDGVCKGISMMIAQAHITGQMEMFDEVLNFIKQNPSAGRLNKKIEEAKKKVREKTILTPADKLALKVLAFFDGIALYQNPKDHRELFDDPDKLLLQSSEIEISALANSKEMEDEKGLKKQFTIVNLYTEKTLATYLEALVNKLSELKLDTNKIAFQMTGWHTGEEHAIVILYDKTRNQWRLIDPNTLQQRSEELNTDELAKIIRASLFNSTIIATDIFTTSKYADSKQMDFSSLFDIAEHKITKEKVESDLIAISMIIGDWRTMELLIKNSGDVNKTYPSGGTALIYAAQAGRLEIIKFLLTAGADKDKADKDGRTPLMHALEAGHFDVVKCLLAAGTDKEKADVMRTLLRTGAAAKVHWASLMLMYAAYAGDAGMMETMLKAGADVNAVSVDGNTPLIYAAKAGHANMVAHLILEGADIENAYVKDRTPLIYAVKKGHEKTALILIRAGADIEKTDEYGMNPLMYATQKDLEEVVKTLIKEGADVNVDDSGMTPLICAAKEGHVGVIKTLIRAGAVIEKTDEFGCTPLMYAATEGHVGVVKILIEERADVTAVNRGCTALMLAELVGHQDIAELLRQAADKVTAKKPLLFASIRKEKTASDTAQKDDAKPLPRPGGHQ